MLLLGAELRPRNPNLVISHLGQHPSPVLHEQFFKTLFLSQSGKATALTHCSVSAPLPLPILLCSTVQLQIFSQSFFELKCEYTVAQACMQEALNAIDRVHSASSYTVAPCGQLQVACGQAAPEPEALLDEETLTTGILPFVDGIITSAGNASIEPVFAFSASTDPGALLGHAWHVCLFSPVLSHKHHFMQQTAACKCTYGVAVCLFWLLMVTCSAQHINLQGCFSPFPVPYLKRHTAAEVMLTTYQEDSCRLEVLDAVLYAH